MIEFLKLGNTMIASNTGDRGAFLNVELPRSKEINDVHCRSGKKELMNRILNLSFEKEWRTVGKGK